MPMKAELAELFAEQQVTEMLIAFCAALNHGERPDLHKAARGQQLSLEQQLADIEEKLKRHGQASSFAKAMEDRGR